MTSRGSGKDIRHCFAGDPIEASGARAGAAPSLALRMTAWRDFRREHVATLELHLDAAPALGCDRREIADAEFMGRRGSACRSDLAFRARLPRRRRRVIVATGRMWKKQAMSSAKGRMAETYRSVVAPWECDVMGHLTIAYYFDRFADAAFALIERLDVSVPPGAAWRSTDLLVRYRQELRAGDGVFIRSGVIGVAGEAIRIGHELVNAGSGEIATTVEHSLAPRELPYGGSAEHRRALADAVVEWESLGFDAIVAPSHGDRMIDTGRDRVKAWEVDERGELSLAGYVHRFAYACLHVCSAFGMNAAYMRQHRRGFSTFETRLHVLAPPPGAGDGLVLKSGVIAAGNSSLRLLHELRQAKSGERLALFHQAGVHFDMEARRSAPMPAELREKAQGLVVA
jgi:acyl-CoA thioester hydrolase